MPQKVRVIFEPKTLVDILLAAQVCDVEVSGLAKVRKEGHVYTIYDDPIIFKQTCSIHETRFDELAYMLWQEKMVINNTPEEIGRARLWWHSHVWARVGFSIKDERTLAAMGLDFDWWLALVINKRFQAYMELREYKPEILPGILIGEYEFTEKISQQDFRLLFDQRKSKMEEIIRDKVEIVEGLGAKDDDWED